MSELSMSELNALKKSGGQLFRLACLIGQLDIGGTEKQLLYFLENVDRSLFEVEVWVTSRGGRWQERVTALNVPLVIIDSTSVLRKAMKIRGLAIRRHIDLVWSWSYYTNCYLGLLPRAISSVGSVRGSLSYCRKSVGALYPLCEPPFKAMVVNSSDLVNELTNVHYKGKVFWIGNMIHPISITDEKRNVWRRRLGCKKNDRLIVGVGRLDKNKNFRLLINALADLPLDNLRIAIIGDGPEMGSLLDLASVLGLQERILFLGEVENATEIIASADLLVHPSFSEGMSNVVAEAVAASIPVVSTRVGGLNDLIPSSEYGWPVPQNDVQAMKIAIEDALAHPEDASMKARLAHERAISLFSPNVTAKRIEDLVSVIVGAR